MAAITVQQLCDILHDMPADAIVIVSKDAEGNGFSPLPDEYWWSEGMYAPDTTWCGEYYDPTDPDVEVPDNAVVAICLWPTN